MAKGDAGRAQNTITQQGGMAQGKIDQLWGDYNGLAYGGGGGGYRPQQNRARPTNPLQNAKTGMGKQMSQGFETLIDKATPQGGWGGYPQAQGGGGGNYQPFTQEALNQMLAAHGGAVTPQSLAAIENELLSKYGVKLQKNSAGEIRGRVYLPDGTAVDVVDQWGLPSVFKFGGENMYGNGGGGGGGYLGGLQNALGGYGNFAATGGFSPQDIQNIRARANAPIRGIYSQGRDELERAKNLQGGYMPNFAPAMAKMSREAAYAAADNSVNTEAMLAEAIRSGRLAGLGGLSNLGLGLGGQRIDLAQLQNQLALGTMNAQLGKSQIPGDFSQAMGNIGQVLNPISLLF